MMNQSLESFPEQMNNTPYACETTKRICQQQQNIKDITPSDASAVPSATPTKAPAITTVYPAY
jgi:hypothetical protein